ncbi:MAG: DUF2157 domain-containing protein [Campylobacterota bacterium]
MDINSKQTAQQRADQIRSFQAELELMEKEQVFSLDAQQHGAIERYHHKLLTKLSSSFDVDTNRQEKQLSLGMKIASFLAALGLAASIFFLFFKFWGGFSTTLQVIILIATPFALLGITIYLNERELTSYYVKIAALLSLSSFVLNLVMLGQIFNITPSPNALFVWAVFAVLLAYASDTRLLLGAGIIAFTIFLSAKFGAWNGLYWINFGERPENFFPAALALFLVSFLPHEKFSGFGPIYRVFSMIIFFLPVLILSNWGPVSYLEMDKESIEMLYQVVGFGFSALAIYVGIKKSLPEVTNTGNVFFVIFLYTKFFDWWWEAMPKYLFFLVIGLSAVLILIILKRFRAGLFTRVGGGS